MAKKGGQPNNKNAEKWTEKEALKLGEDLISWLLEKDENGLDKENIFFREFLVMEKGLDKKTTNYLSNKFNSFSTLIKKATEIQEIKLVKYGVGGRLQPTMAIFCLKNNHGYKDSKDIDHTTKGESLNDLSSLSTEELIKRAEATGVLNERKG